MLSYFYTSKKIQINPVFVLYLVKSPKKQILLIFSSQKYSSLSEFYTMSGPYRFDYFRYKFYVRFNNYRSVLKN